MVLGDLTRVVIGRLRIEGVGMERSSFAQIGDVPDTLLHQTVISICADCDAVVIHLRDRNSTGELEKYGFQFEDGF